MICSVLGNPQQIARRSVTRPGRHVRVPLTLTSHLKLRSALHAIYSTTEAPQLSLFTLLLRHLLLGLGRQHPLQSPATSMPHGVHQPWKAGRRIHAGHSKYGCGVFEKAEI